MTLFAPVCGARLRKKPDQTCRAPALQGHTRCRLHQGRPKGAGSPEGLAATRTGHAAYQAKRKAAVRRGETVNPSGGKRKRWPIPRPWRYRLDEAQEAVVLRAMLEHDMRVRGGAARPAWEPITSTAAEARALGDFERSLVIRLNDPDQLLTKDEMERLYDLARGAEHAFRLPGADVRLNRLAWERERFLLRRMTTKAPELSPFVVHWTNTQGCRDDRAPEPAAPARGTEWLTPRRPPPDDFRDSICPPHRVESVRVEIDERKRRLAHFNLAESTARSLDAELARAGSEAAQLAVLDRWIAGMERAAAMTERIVAGRDAAAEQRAMRPRQQEGPHSITPWLRRS